MLRGVKPCSSQWVSSALGGGAEGSSCAGHSYNGAGILSAVLEGRFLIDPSKPKMGSSGGVPYQVESLAAVSIW
jgi:hypothetical protein